VKRPGLLGELVAEFLGTLILLAFGSGVCAMVVLFGTGAPGEIVHGGWTNITIGWRWALPSASG
jgi:glycerol uptake facilitator protein